MIHSPLETTALFHVGPVGITEPVITTWVLMVILVGVSAIITHRLSLAPSKASASRLRPHAPDLH